jgi:mono/diheme cytochrome c family protein
MPAVRWVLGGFACALVLAGCASVADVAPPVTAAMVAVGAGASAATLEEGRRTFTTRCTSCHSADPVAGHSPSEWSGIVATMSARARLTPAQESALLAYLHAAPKVRPSPPES